MKRLDIMISTAQSFWKGPDADPDKEVQAHMKNVSSILQVVRFLKQNKKIRHENINSAELAGSHVD